MWSCRRRYSLVSARPQLHTKQGKHRPVVGGFDDRTRGILDSLDVILVAAAEHDPVLEAGREGTVMVTPPAHHPPWEAALVHKRQIHSFITLHLKK